ncbi:MAG: hypothetical protein FWG51_00395 [Firmicutes bacterium]|nr:hypothetical protein [Bacillota bacterium]
MTKKIKKDKSETLKNTNAKKPTAATAKKPEKATMAQEEFLDVETAAKDIKKVMPAAKKTVEKSVPAVEKAMSSVEKTAEKAVPDFMKNNSKNRKKEVQVLKQLYQNADMGKTGIDNILKKTNNSSFRHTLLGHYEKYDDISQKISKELTRNGETRKDTAFFNKAMQWSSINAGTLFDKSLEHLADMLIKGNNVGMISITKELNAHKDVLSDSTNSLASELLDIQQKNIEELKPYL